jgi:hypothetical protein
MFCLLFPVVQSNAKEPARSKNQGFEPRLLNLISGHATENGGTGETTAARAAWDIVSRHISPFSKYLANKVRCDYPVRFPCSSGAQLRIRWFSWTRSNAFGASVDPKLHALSEDVRRTVAGLQLKPDQLCRKGLVAPSTSRIRKKGRASGKLKEPLRSEAVLTVGDDLAAVLNALETSNASNGRGGTVVKIKRCDLWNLKTQTAGHSIGGRNAARLAR